MDFSEIVLCVSHVSINISKQFLSVVRESLAKLLKAGTDPGSPSQSQNYGN